MSLTFLGLSYGLCKKHLKNFYTFCICIKSHSFLYNSIKKSNYKNKTRETLVNMARDKIIFI